MLGIANALNITKAVATYTSPLWIASGFIIFAPTRWLAFLKLHDFRNNYIAVASLIFLFSSSFIVASIIAYIGRRIKANLRARAFDKQIANYIQRLTPEEKSYLRRYIENNTQTQKFPIQDGVVQGLVRKKILYRSTQVGDLYGGGFAFNMVPVAYTYLMKNQKFLQGI